MKRKLGSVARRYRRDRVGLVGCPSVLVLDLSKIVSGMIDASGSQPRLKMRKAIEGGMLDVDELNRDVGSLLGEGEQVEYEFSKCGCIQGISIILAVDIGCEELHLQRLTIGGEGSPGSVNWQRLTRSP
jgi:hypothetical protein